MANPIPPGTLVSILMGSNSDWPCMKLAADTLEEFGVACDARVISAHRKASRLVEYLREAEREGVKVFIAGAGGAAHLPGVTAAHTTRPVLGVPIKSSLSGGLDSLLSIVQMPKGIPVGTLATGNAGAINAAILAAQIIGTADADVAERVAAHRRRQAETLEEMPFLPE